MIAECLRCASHPNRGQNNVHAEPVATAGFSWERATKVQCVLGEKYALPESCEERTYFSDMVFACDQLGPS